MCLVNARVSASASSFNHFIQGVTLFFLISTTRYSVSYLYAISHIERPEAEGHEPFLVDVMEMQNLHILDQTLRIFVHFN